MSFTCGWLKNQAVRKQTGKVVVLAAQKEIIGYRQAKGNPNQEVNKSLKTYATGPNKTLSGGCCHRTQGSASQSLHTNSSLRRVVGRAAGEQATSAHVPRRLKLEADCKKLVQTPRRAAAYVPPGAAIKASGDAH